MIHIPDLKRLFRRLVSHHQLMHAMCGSVGLEFTADLGPVFCMPEGNVEVLRTEPNAILKFQY